jgi:hypothetical protein
VRQPRNVEEVLPPSEAMPTNARGTVNTYEQWLRRFLRFHQMRHPREMGSDEVNEREEVTAFLSHLASTLEGGASPPRTRCWQRCCFSIASCMTGP